MSLAETIQQVNQTVRGWHTYFKRSLPSVLARLDEMIRRRLRSILMKRRRKRGMAWRQANRIWPMAYFTERGLSIMAPASVTRRRSR